MAKGQLVEIEIEMIVVDFTVDGKRVKLRRPDGASKEREVRGLDTMLQCKTSVPQGIIPGQEVYVTLSPVERTQEGQTKVYTTGSVTRVIFGPRSN